MSDKHMEIGLAIGRDAGLRQFDRIPYEFREHARSAPQDKAIEAAVPVDDETLAIFAHEAGHLATTSDNWHKPLLTREFLATQWGLDAIKRHGGEVTPVMLGALRDALQSYADRVQHVPQYIEHFIKGE